MQASVIIFLMSLSLGQLGAVPVVTGVQIYVHEIFLIVLLGIIGWNKRSHIPVSGHRLAFFLQTPVVREASLFSFAALVSLVVAFFSFTPAQVFGGSLYLVRFLLYASVLLTVGASGVRPSVWLKWLYGSAVIVAILGFLQLLWYPSLQNLVYAGWDPHHYRLFSTFLDPNFAGIYLLLGLLLGFLFVTEKKIYWLTQMILFAAVLTTYSRSTYAAAAVVLLVGLYRAKGTLVAFGAIALFGLLVVLFPRTPGDTLRLDRFDSSFGRFKSWQWAVEKIVESPIVGHGFSTLRYMPRPDETVAQMLVSRASAGVDNSFLFVGATTGALGLGAFYLLLRSLFTQSQKLLITLSSWLSGIILQLSFVAILVHSQFSNSFFYPWVMIWLWVLCGSVYFSKKK